MRIRNINLTEGTIWKQIFAFALPLLIMNLMQHSYSVIDLMIVGNFSGVESMAGIGATASIINMLLGLALGLSTGCSVVVSQANGAHDYDKLYRAVHTSYALALVSGIVISLIGVFLAPHMLMWMGTPAEILPHATTYLRIYFAGGLSVIIYNMGAGILRGVGDTRHPFIYLSIGVVFNVLLDLLFIGVFDWGVAGAGWAFVIAQTLVASLVTISLARSLTPFRLFIRDIAFHGEVLGDALKVGIPAGLQAAIVAISNVFLQSVINTFGKHAVAGYTAATRSDGFVFVVINGLALAVMTFVGVNMGAGRYDRVKRGLKESLALTFVVIVSVSAVIILFRYPIASLFNSDPDVIRYSTRTMMFILSFYWLFALCEVMGGLLRGIGHSIYPMVISLVCMAGVRLAWIAIVLPAWNSYDGLLMAYPVSWLVSFIAYIAYLKLKRGIFPKENEEADGVMAPEAEA
ncbi:MAG TPA: MATE family efflux transporter [Bacillota bacterium]|nr:MATE family efflux transporter [Bacillota bacterium]HQC48075.1 MATE family efflux transporter [Bacillota bacterium]